MTLNREPSLIVTLAAILVKIVFALGVHSTPHQQAMVNAAAAAGAGLVVTYLAHDSMSAGILGFMQAAVAVMVGYGMHVTADQQALVMSVAAMLAASFVRTQVTAKTAAAHAPAHRKA